MYHHLLALAALLFPAAIIGASQGQYDMDFCYCDFDEYLQEFREDMGIVKLFDKNKTSDVATFLPSDREKRSTTTTTSNYPGQVFWAPTSELRKDLQIANATESGGIIFRDITETVAMASNCSCTQGSVIKMRMCLQNLNYTGLSDSKSDHYEKVAPNVMQQVYSILSESMKKETLFRRVQLLKFEAEGDKGSAAVVQVDLTRDETYKGIFHVESAIEPKTRGISPTIAGYEVSMDCITFEDITPEIPVVRSALWYLRFLCIPVALMVAGLVFFLTCCKKRDSFYVRFW